MKQVAYIIIALCVFLACGGNRQQENTLMRARAVMNDHPDSAIAILDSLYRHEAEMDNHFRMQVLLHRTEAQNKLFTRFPSDSIQTKLVWCRGHALQSLRGCRSPRCRGCAWR